MRQLTFAVLLATLSLTTFANADDWSKTCDWTGKPDLHLQASDAHVRIEPWDQNKIEVHVTTRGWHIGGGDLEIVEHQQGNAVDLELRRHSRTHFSIGIDTRRTDLEIPMPRSAKVNVHSGDGSIQARALEGELEFSSGDGRLDLEHLGGTLRAKTSDGSVRAAGRFDALDLDTSDGRIDLEARSGSQLLGAWEDPHLRSECGATRDLAANVE